MTHNPFDPPQNSPDSFTPGVDADRDRQATPSVGPVRLFISHDTVERTLIQDCLNEHDIPFHVSPIDTANSLGAGFSGFGHVAAMGPVEISVPGEYAEEAHAAVRARLAEITPAGSQQEAAEVSDQIRLAEKEFRRRRRNSWVFLLPGMIPYAPIVALINALEALKIAKAAPHPMPGLIWAQIALGLSGLLSLAHIAFTLFLFAMFFS